MKYAVIIEEGQNSFGAYVPDLPDCIAVGASRSEVVQLIREAIEMHVQGLLDQGVDGPRAASSVETVNVAA